MGMKQSWDMTVDVLVAGSGYAGCMAAIAAHDAGSSTLILEKMPRFGGLSILSAGGMAVSDDAEAAFLANDRAMRYFQHFRTQVSWRTDIL